MKHRPEERNDMKTNFESRNGEVTGGRRQEPSYSLRNDFGFWQLTFNGQQAVLQQDQALFYVKFLLANPPSRPLDGYDFATQVFDLYSDHPDFRQGMTWISGDRSGSKVVKVLSSKQKALEAILDADDTPEPVKAEVLRELEVIYDLQKTYFTEIASTAESTGDIIMDGLKRLHASLANETDARGNPCPVRRHFATHLLLYILMPSIRASAQVGLCRFTYHPPSDVTWT
jgi:hypothetical protein